LLTTSFPAVDLAARDDLTPEWLEERNFQLVTTLGNLAGRLRIADGQFPPRPKAVLMAHPGKVAALRAEYAAAANGRKLIGLSWRHAKSTPQWPTPLDAWLPLIDRPDVMVVALHPAAAEAELADFAQRTGRDLIFDRRMHLSGDLGEYAVQVQACDFVVAVEDLTAVLSGAMGKPTVKLKRSIDHWWWGLAAAENRWFADMRTVTAPQGPDEAAVVEVLNLMDRTQAN
jgi:hypothetical protein